MNIQDYRESKINKYPDRQTGLLMYRHEKLFDIVKTIENFINLSIDGEPSTEEYKNFLDNLKEKLPKKYREIHEDNFINYIEDYDKSQIHTKLFENRIYRLIQNTLYGGMAKQLNKGFKNKIKNRDIIKNKRYGSTEIFTIKKEALRKAINGKKIDGEYRGDNVILVHDKMSKYRNDDIIKHEFLHYIHTKGLIGGYNKEKNESVNYRKNINNSIKSEFLSQLQSNKIGDEGFNIIDILEKYYLSRRLSEQLNRQIKIHNKSIEIDGKTINEKYIKEDLGTKEEYDIVKKVIHYKKLIIDMTLIYYELLQIISPKYYNYNQFSYLLSFTPLYQRQSLLDYYKKLNSLNQTPIDLHSTLSEPHDSSPL